MKNTNLSHNESLAPIKLFPAFKDYLWGGNRLVKEYNKKSDLDIVAESWELSTHKDGESTVDSGIFKCAPLSEYIAKNPKVLGTKASGVSELPVLAKLIDAKDNLSVQVHPNEEYAQIHHNQHGKTEMWHVLDCENGACLYYGFKRETSAAELEEAIKNNTVTELLNKVEVKRGDTFFIEAGTVHAIGSGILIYELQQNSNVTYRLYDYDRRDKNGNTRPLHIADALAVAKKEPTKPHTNISDGLLAKCDIFTAEKIKLTDKTSLPITEDSFVSLVITEGEGRLRLGDSEIDLRKGDSIFIPAQNNVAELTGCCDIICATL